MRKCITNEYTYTEVDFHIPVDRVYIAASRFRLVCVVVLVTDAEHSYVGASKHGSFPPALALDLSLPSPLTSIR